MGEKSFLRENWFEMSDLFSSLLIFTIIQTILSTFFFTVSKFYKNLVKWALTEMLCSIAGMTTLDREWYTHYLFSTKEIVQYTYSKEIKTMFHSILCRFLSAFLKIYWQISMCDFVFFPNMTAENHPPTKQN